MLVLYNAVSGSAAPDEADVLAQLAAVREALCELGHQVFEHGADLDLSAVQAAVRAHRPDVVFNLVESLAGSARLLAAAPGLLDALHVPYTGASAEALYVTTHKLLTKERLEAAGLPTARWWASAGEQSPGGFVPGRHILKSVWEHASLGLDDAAVVDVKSEAALAERLAARRDPLGGRCFAEAFVEGRELNVALVGPSERPELLPAGEICFTDYPPEKPRIVGYQSKWVEGSFEYQHTPRRLDFGPEDRPLLETLGQLSLAAWRLFGLSGYARVDFRVDAAGRPFILEVNANPCLAPDAGFAVMVERAGWTYREVIRRILSARLTET